MNRLVVGVTVGILPLDEGQGPWLPASKSFGGHQVCSRRMSGVTVHMSAAQGPSLGAGVLVPAPSPGDEQPCVFMPRGPTQRSEAKQVGKRWWSREGAGGRAGCQVRLLDRSGPLPGPLGIREVLSSSHP